MPESKTSTIATGGCSKDENDHHQDSSVGYYPASAFTLSDSAPTPALLTKNTSKSPALAATSPTRPAPFRQSSTIRQPPNFNLDELRSVFPSDLPPRFQPKRNFLTRMFRSRASSNEDIELGSQVLPSESFWAFMITDWHFWLAVLLWVVCIGLAGIVYQGVKGHSEIPVNGTNPMGDIGGF